ncbi:hypothetical protein NDU88_007340 [Pleurodeles waltl]|uniref:Uncharacterized protein n=1 Tax=Pleurodeles waltl TaxID=8319 RepID=A0AAV7LV43_PLEWA|nr:hypothetical protein NDU88_007340 [Pleurodeles waltl]
MRAVCSGLGGAGRSPGRTDSWPRGPAMRPSGRGDSRDVSGSWAPLASPPRARSEVGSRTLALWVCWCAVVFAQRPRVVGWSSTPWAEDWAAGAPRPVLDGFELPRGQLRGWRLAGPPPPRTASAGEGGLRGILGWSAALGLAVVLAGCHFAQAWVPSLVGSGRRRTVSCCTSVAPPPPRQLDSSARGWYLGGLSEAVWSGRHQWDPALWTTG